MAAGCAGIRPPHKVGGGLCCGWGPAACETYTHTNKGFVCLLLLLTRWVSEPVAYVLLRALLLGFCCMLSLLLPRVLQDCCLS